MIEKIERFYLEINTINDLKTKQISSDCFSLKETSKDNFDLVTEKGLAGSFSVMKSIIRGMEFGIYPEISVLCEPQLGKRGLYPNTSKNYKGTHPEKIRMDIIAYCDGKTTIFDIAKKLKINLNIVLDELSLLAQENLLKDRI